MNLCMLLLIILHGVMLLVFGEMIMKKTHDIVLNDLFPHTSVLMALSNKSSFIIDDRKLFDIQKIFKKVDIICLNHFQ